MKCALQPRHLGRAVTILALFAAFTISSCRLLEENSDSTNDEPSDVAVESGAAPARSIPTLYPTPTLIPSPSPTATRPKATTEVASTPVDFEQTVVEVRYQIPALGLDRAMVGNVSGQVEIIDYASGLRLTKRDQAAVILQLQQILPQVELVEPPQECGHCVIFGFDLPMANESGSGWLQNVQLLASLENYTAANLGPHFPPETVLGLRRSATPYYEAHTIAITSDGVVWDWTAIEDRISDGQPAPPIDTAILTALEELTEGDLSENYAEACPQGSGVETLLLNLGEIEQSVQLICPELALPTSLLPIYLELLSMAEELIDDGRLNTPVSEITVDSIIHLGLQDGLRMNVLNDNNVAILTSDGITVTGTISSSIVISLTAELSQADGLKAGVNEYLAGTTSNFLIFRGYDSLYESHWEETPPGSLVSTVRLLEAIASNLIEKEIDVVDLEE